MKALLLCTLMIIMFAMPAQAHALKRNCLWAGNNIFRVHTLCRDGNNAPRATPSRSVTPPDVPDKPDCKDDDGKHHGKGKGHDKD
jgi:hypothetical protein